jgi:hypothetical protein
MARKGTNNLSDAASNAPDATSAAIGTGQLSLAPPLVDPVILRELILGLVPMAQSLMALSEAARNLLKDLQFQTCYNPDERGGSPGPLPEYGVRKQDAELVGLAIELARLHGNADPALFLPEAARLKLVAAEIWQTEKARWRKERHGIHTRDDVAGILQEQYESDRVPFERLCRPGKRAGGSATQDEFEEFTVRVPEKDDSRPFAPLVKKTFQWKVYISQKGFEQLVEKHWQRFCERRAQELRRSLCVAQPQPERVAPDLLALPPGHPMREELLRLRTGKAAESFIERWQPEAVRVNADLMMQRVKLGDLGITSVHELWLTRKSGETARAAKTAQARQRKATPGQAGGTKGG